MTGRSLPEWIGTTPDTSIPPRVRLRVWERCEGRCGECGRKITPSDTWIVEHLTALINGGQNRESNLGITCGWCKPNKDARDVAEKAKVAKVKAKNLGIKPKPRWPSRPLGNGNHQHTATSPIQRKGERA